MASKWNRVVFICLCLIAGEIEHPFIRLSANLAPALWSPNLLPIFLFYSPLFFLLICRGSLHMSDISFQGLASMLALFLAPLAVTAALRVDVVGNLSHLHSSAAVFHVWRQQTSSPPKISLQIGGLWLRSLRRAGWWASSQLGAHCSWLSPSLLVPLLSLSASWSLYPLCAWLQAPPAPLSRSLLFPGPQLGSCHAAAGH